MIRLGITGGIGGGKSYLSAILREKNIPVYDTDDRAKKLMLTHPLIRSELTDLLGTDVYKQGELNKKLLSDYLFMSEANASRINSIVHPRVKDDFKTWAALHASQRLVAMECAILFEAGFTDLVNSVCVVYAPLEVRIRRAMKRDSIDRQQVCSRIAAQMNDDEKVRLADFVLLNDGTQDLSRQVDAMLQSLYDGKAGL